MSRIVIVLFALFGCVAPANEAMAHARSVSYSTWVLDEDGAGASIRARLSRLDANLLESVGIRSVDGDLERYVGRALRLFSGGKPCEIDEPPETRGGGAEWIDVRFHVRCPSALGLTMESDIVVDANPSHIHFAKIIAPSGSAGERVLDVERRRAAISEAPTKPDEPKLGGFIAMGVEHIATGWDHLLFVAMLVFLGTGWRRAALAVTGFTIGHSLTLSLAMLGVAAAHERPVEALIGLSIALLAVENTWLLWRRRGALLPLFALVGISLVTLLVLVRERHGALSYAGALLFAACSFAWLRRSSRPLTLRALIALLFGLVHGFGFAKALAELHLPKHRLAMALFGFNLGVELGQIACVVLLWPLLVLIRTRRGLVRWVFAAAACAGTYWFVSRALA